jgi:hypothetical protein
MLVTPIVYRNLQYADKHLFILFLGATYASHMFCSIYALPSALHLWMRSYLLNNFYLDKLHTPTLSFYSSLHPICEVVPSQSVIFSKGAKYTNNVAWL